MTFLNEPLLILFGFLFVLTTLSSFLYLSYLGLYGVFVINLISLFLFWASSVLYYYKYFLFDNCTLQVCVGRWFTTHSGSEVGFNLLIDTLSISFIILILTIATAVLIYSFAYFRYEPNVERLMLLLNCFVASMIILVSASNLFVLFFGWELIGITSFFLINFWMTRMGTVKSAFKAFTFNKISDSCILFALIILYNLDNNLDILVINQFSSLSAFLDLNFLNSNLSIIEIVSFLLLISSFIKSAQFGFHIWLPDSMEAPVPASALIHSATLVSAGIFLILRLYNLFELSTIMHSIVPIVGAFTAFFGGLCAVFQTDVKRILAYSTISHCGYLMVSVTMCHPDITIIYLFVHGFFKALTFLCVGNVIRVANNYQDIRTMGVFYKLLPFECCVSFWGLSNLAGLPFVLGFYMKHILFEASLKSNFYDLFIVALLVAGSVCGVIYSYRLFFYVFFDFKKSKKSVYNKNITEVFNKNYTNSAKAVHVSLLFLIYTSYFFSGYLIFKFLINQSFNPDIYFILQNEFLNINLKMYNKIKLLGYINWIYILVILIVTSVTWRFLFNNVNLFLSINILILFYLSLYMCMFIILY